MRHFVGYHNPKKMGRSAFKETDPFSLYTNKNVSNLVGDVVWLITGQGKPRKTFLLYAWFVVDEVIPSDDSDFGLVIRGKTGGELDPVPILNDEPWWPEFFRRTANFSLGFSEVRESEIIDAFREMTVEGNCPQTY